MTSRVDQDDIERGLREIGLREGHLVVVHSSLSSFGYVVGGPDTVIDALLKTVGPKGTVIMPAHTGVAKTDFAAYDPASTPVRKSIGRIPDTFWRRPDVIRGKHPPRHNWAAQGRLAPALIALSEGQPVAAGHYKDILTAVADLDGHVLLLGCRNRNNTSIHSAEAAAFLAVEGIPRAKREFLRSLPKRPEDFDQLDEPLIEAGAMRVGRIGDAEIRWMRSPALFSVVRRVYESRYRDADAARSYPEDVPEAASLAARYDAVVHDLRELQRTGGTQA